MVFIGDRVQIVMSLLGGRTDKASDISQWLASGYRDLAHSIPFETLEQTQNLVCSPTQDTYPYPSDARAIKSLTIQVPAVNPASSRPLRKRNKNIIDRYTNVNPGVPAIWCPYNSNFILRPVPNDAYPIILNYWQMVELDPDDINDTEILLPDDWIEIVDYEAQMRGWMDLQEFDKAATIRTLLYGNPMKPGMPGLIKQRLTRIQAESENADYGVRPRLSRYTNTK